MKYLTLCVIGLIIYFAAPIIINPIKKYLEKKGSSKYLVFGMKAFVYFVLLVLLCSIGDLLGLKTIG